METKEEEINTVENKEEETVSYKSALTAPVSVKQINFAIIEQTILVRYMYVCYWLGCRP